MKMLILRPSNLVKVLGLPFICLAMFTVAGGHWAVLQSVAWGQMLWNYSQEEGSVFAGAQKTFSGKAPCSMCKKIIAAKKQEERAPASVKLDKKSSETTLVIFANPISLPTQRDAVFYSSQNKFLTRSDAPPTPVPIARA